MYFTNVKKLHKLFLTKFRLTSHKFLYVQLHTHSRPTDSSIKMLLVLLLNETLPTYQRRQSLIGTCWSRCKHGGGHARRVRHAQLAPLISPTITQYYCR